MKNIIKKMLTFEVPEEKERFIIKEEENVIKYDIRKNKEIKDEFVSTDYNYNLEYIKNRFSYPENNDFVIRKLNLKGNVPAFIIFYDGMVSASMVDLSIVETLQKMPFIMDEKIKPDAEEIMERYIGHGQVMATEKFSDIIDEVNFGSCGLFIDGLDKGYAIDVRLWINRGI